MRWLLWLLGGVILGGIVHLVTIMLLPQAASQDAYARLTPIAAVNTMAAIPPPTPERSMLPFLDPAFAMAVCRYDLAEAPLKLTVPVSPWYTSVTFYTRQGVAYYAINDRAAGRRLIELELMTSDQRAMLPGDEEITSADRLIIESPSMTGLILVKALAVTPGTMPVVRGVLAAAQCNPQPFGTN